MKSIRRSSLGRVALFSIVVSIGLVLAGSQALAQPEHNLKLATLAPKGSSWMKAFERIERDIEKDTGGQVGVQVFAGGVMGDESAMVRKMRTGQLDGAAVTSVGLGEIDQKLLVLQLPLIFRNHKELDYVRDQMSDTFEGMLSDQGFELMTWGDVGFNYLFSQTPVETPADIKRTRPWVWNADPITKAVMEVANVNAVPLGVPDVLPSLQTGVIDAFPNSPYGAVALQWYTKAKYVTNLRLAVVIGGVVISRDCLEELPEEHRGAVEAAFANHGEDLLSQIRGDNERAIQTIQKAGVQSVEPKDLEAWKKIAKDAREELSGTLFPEALVDEMMNHLQAAR
ncbi:MAG: TRAP transporter substrate-binding protein DctP [Persicimonas sp.]